jgi:hypothetical protein
MPTKKIDEYQFVAALSEEMRLAHTSAASPPWNTHIAATLARDLTVWATKLNHLNELDCNEGETEERRLASVAITQRVAKALAPYGIAATIQHDPRGPAVKLALKRSGRSNDFGGEGLYCVPEIDR